MVQPVPETINFPQTEEEILAYWNKIDAFTECLKLSKGNPQYSFYDGPPFATGLPHYGHILAGTIKDVVTRYAYQNGYHVERRFGWDCHGLPVEFEIDKKFGFKGPEDVEKFGVANYNQECRNIVMRYSQEWESVVTRIGRWIDFKNDYKTLYPWFMESVWWVFSELWRKGLVYRGVKVMPFSTACNTPLSNFESGQNYKEVTDPAVVVKFQLVKDNKMFLLAWTTTPWTLPSNLALCVNPELTYVILKEESTGDKYVLMQSRVSEFFKPDGDKCYTRNDSRYTVLEHLPGKKLAEERYHPLFPYFAQHSSGFRVLTDNYVTEESGTGIVHQAPYFGEDDYRVCLNHGVITKDQEAICPLDASGKFTLPVTDFLGQYVKDADKNIMKKLKESDRLFNVGRVVHNYPFCWRSETPLIYKAVPSWFIRVQQMSNDLVNANNNTYWVPDFVKEKRFGNWLKDARDWAVSRNRYWGTPIPLWASEDFDEIVCVGSIKELEELTGETITDLHRESIDHLVIPSSKPGKPPLKRVTEVFDCWFESGSMPYAQLHYPFENKNEFDKKFPADFIAEGIDQTRGWFYTLLVISTCLFNKAPFKNLIVNGMVLASDGQKMSKSKKNFPDPTEVINKFGADALRLYLINSPVVRGDKLRFREEGVRDVLKDVFLPWYNAYRFLIQNLEKLKKETGYDLTFSDEEFTPNNFMDKWILSFTQSLNVFVRKEMAAYRLYTVVPRLVEFIDNLTNWYVRMNRRRLKGETNLEDCKEALSTLGCVLSTMIRLMAPCTPFLTEKMFENFKILTKRTEKSIHFVQMPQPRLSIIDEEIERAVAKMQIIIDLGRVSRDRKTIPLKYPLKEVVVILNSVDSVREIEPLKNYITEELNVKQVTLSADKQTYGVYFRAEPDHKTLGPRLKDKFAAVTEAIKKLQDSDIERVKTNGEIEISGEIIKENDLRIMLSFKGEKAEELSQKYETNARSDVLILLDVTPDDEMIAEGTARELINRVQKLRKKAHLVPTDDIRVYYSVSPTGCELERVVQNFAGYIENALKAPFTAGKPPASSTVIIEDTQQLKSTEKGVEVWIAIVGGAPKKAVKSPNCRYANLLFNENPSSKGDSTKCATVLLENPVGYNRVSLSDIKFHVQTLFKLYNRRFALKTSDGKEPSDQTLSSFTGTLYVIDDTRPPVKEFKSATCGVATKFVNVEYETFKGTLILENPAGTNLPSDDVIDRAVNLFSTVVKSNEEVVRQKIVFN